MKEFTFDEMMKEKPRGGVSYFKLNAGEEAIVRFLYDGGEDVIGFSAHKFMIPGNSALIRCSRIDENSPASDCKWCNLGYKPMDYIIIPIYNEDKQQIEYWERPTSILRSTLGVYFKETLNNGQNIASQVYKLKREGSDKQTKYFLFPMGAPDGKSKRDFGDVKTPTESGLLKEADYDYDPNKQPEQNTAPSNNYNQPNNYNQGNNYNQNNGYNTQATRRTSDIW